MRVRCTAMSGTVAAGAGQGRGEPWQAQRDGKHYPARVEVLRVVGGARLEGSVEVVGAKNSVLKLMAAALLAPGETTLGNLPAISDVRIMHELLERLGCEVSEAIESAGG